MQARQSSVPVLLAVLLAPALLAGVASEPVSPERALELTAGGVDTYFLGRQDKDQLGNDLRVGDVNGDGTLDLVLAAHWGSVAGRNIQGRTYVKFGAPDWPATVDLAQLLAPSWSFMGTNFESRLGSAVATGDLNGDGVSDLALGSVLADPYGQANGGAVYVMFGGPAVKGHVDFLSAQPDAFVAGASRTGGEADRIGTDLAIGDFNGDGRQDLAIAAAFRNDFAGTIFVFWGPFVRGGIYNLQDRNADWTILGPASDAFLGAALVSADLNGDGVDDLLASAYRPDATSSPDRGAVHVFHGRQDRGGVTDLAGAPADLTVIGPTGSYMGAALSPGSCSCRGQSLAVADLTGDGVPDLLAGAPLAENRLGNAFLIAGPLRTGTIDLAQEPSLRLRGSATDGRLGWTVATGALDGDGQVDLLLAAPWAANGAAGGAGLVFGLRGPLPADGEINVEAGNVALLARGTAAGGGNAGASLVLADTSGDGIDDLHVGLPDSAPLGRRSVGAVYVVRGPLLATLPTATLAVSATPPPSPSPTSTAVPSSPTSPSPTDTLPPPTSPTEPPTATPPASPTPASRSTATRSTATATTTVPATAPYTPPPSASPTPDPTAGHPRTIFLPFAHKPRRGS